MRWLQCPIKQALQCAKMYVSNFAMINIVSVPMSVMQCSEFWKMRIHFSAFDGPCRKHMICILMQWQHAITSIDLPALNSKFTNARQLRLSRERKYDTQDCTCLMLQKNVSINGPQYIACEVKLHKKIDCYKLLCIVLYIFPAIHAVGVRKLSVLHKAKSLLIERPCADVYAIDSCRCVPGYQFLICLHYYVVLSGIPAQ